ncbi:MAG: dihydrodipicolinate reductase [Candidatus Sumerlaeia bacterium]|nr:dihydrodipicolinate reductase [Candidatus Sumerlaeia bacterium]
MSMSVIPEREKSAAATRGRSVIRVVQVGLGPIGCQAVRYLAERPSLALVGAVDIDPAKHGRDAGEIVGLEKPLGVAVDERLGETLRATKPDVAVVTTASSVVKVMPTLMEIVTQGINVVSTCEELACPWHRAPEESRQLDAAAREHGVTVLGTGVNPGFLMDALPATLTAVCREVHHITVERLQDAQHRRLPFQQKIGVGLTPDQFAAKVTSGTLRHVGLAESMHMVAAQLGWVLDEVQDVISPVTAQSRVTASGVTVEPGQALGVEQIGTGTMGGREVIRLVFRAALGLPETRDRILIKGTPVIEMVIPGGVNGDVATCAITVNAIPAVLAAAPGLKTMTEIPTVSWFC